MSPTTTNGNQLSMLVIMIRAPGNIRGPDNIAWADDISTGADRLIKRAKDVRHIQADKLDLDPTKSAAENALIVQQAAARLASQAKVYLIGHADWAFQKCGDKDPEWVAEALQHIGNIRKLSLLGCSLARDKSTYDDQLITSVDSFASKLHVALGQRHVRIEIQARVFDVKILNNGTKATLIANSWNPSLSTAAHKRKASKILFYWEGEFSCRKWVNYEDKATSDDFSNDREINLLIAELPSF